jgi:hypothetical protein
MKWIIKIPELFHLWVVVVLSFWLAVFMITLTFIPFWVIYLFPFH